MRLPSSFKKVSRVTRVVFLLFFILFVIPQFVRAVERNLNLSATVPAKPNDFQSVLTLLQPSDSTFRPDTTLTYEITYGSLLPYSVDDLTIEASWDLGTIESGNSSADILGYVVGGAANGYNATQPIIDITNRKITWKIPSFPANTTNQKTTFKLKTNSNYTGSSSVSFPVSVQISAVGTKTPKETVTKKYLFKDVTSEPTATPTGQPSASATPTPLPGITITPTPPKPLEIAGIQIRTVSEDSASVMITTSRKTKITLSYGTSPTALSETVTDGDLTQTHLMRLDNLLPQTAYYFRVYAVGKNGAVARSDTITLTTALPSDAPKIDTQSILMMSQNVLLTTPETKLGESKKDQTIVLPVQTGFTFQFKLEKYKTIKRVQAFVRNSSVLGISTFIDEAEASTENVELIEIAPGVYSGKLSTKATPGTYDIFVSIEDTNGNISEEKVGKIRIVPRLTVLDKQTHKPIEDARLLYSRLNLRKNSYEIISELTLPIKNPTFTDNDGQSDTILPPGNYSVKVSALGYNTQQVRFKIGAHSGEEFPTVTLEREPFNIFHTIKYYLTIFMDIFDATKTYALTLSNSLRLVTFLSLITIIALVFLTLLSYSVEVYVPIHLIPHHFLSHFRESKAEREKQTLLAGRILDIDTDKGLSDVEIYLIDQQTRLVMNRTKTNSNGEFRLARLPGRSYTLRIFKLGYHLLIKPIEEDENDVLLSLSVHSGSRLSVAQLRWYTKALLSSTFEALLLFSFLFELTAGYVLGWHRVIVFLCISLLNLALWLHYRKHLRMHQV